MHREIVDKREREPRIIASVDGLHLVDASVYLRKHEENNSRLVTRKGGTD